MEEGPARDSNGGEASAGTTARPGVVPSPAVKSKSEERLRALGRNPGGLAILAIVGLIVLLYPFLDELVGFRKITSVIPILMFIILALGLNVVVGYAGLLDLGYAAFFAIGAYAAAFLTSPISFLNTCIRIENGQQVILNNEVVRDTCAGYPFWYSNFWIAFVAAFFVAIAAGVILGAPTLRLRGDYLAIVTLGFGEIVPIFFRNATTYTNGEKGLSNISRPEVLGFDVGGQPVFGLGNWSSQIPWYYFILGIGVLAVIGLRRLQSSRVGRAWMAMREDEISSSAMGVNLVTTKLSAFGMGASLSGLVGAVYGGYIGVVHPSAFEYSTSVILLCAVILGGLGNIWGVILGGFLILFFDRILSIEMTGWLQGLGTNIGNEFLATLQLSNFRLFLFGLALVLLMIFRPEGIVPNARRRAELKPDEETPEDDEPDDTGVQPPRETVQTRQTLYDTRDKDESAQEQR